MTRSFGPHDDPDIDLVWLWFEFQKELVANARGSVIRMFATGTDAAVEADFAYVSRFIGQTRTEVEEFFEWQRDQLELVTMFELLATAEAILRIEFKARVISRKRDTLSRRFREIQKAKGDKVRLDEDILVAMKEEGVASNIIAAFRGALRLRDWLAHGRHWQPKLGRIYEPNDVFDITRALVNAIPSS